MPIDAAWHKKHPMGMGTTLDQRVKWHVAHAKACDCRKDMPPTILKELKRRGETPPPRKGSPK